MSALRAVAALTGLVPGLTMMAGIPSASAAGQDGHTDTDEFVFYFNSAPSGGVCQSSFSDFGNQKADLAGYNFLVQGKPGFNQPVKNNSACVANFRNANARVFYNSNFQGVDDLIPALSQGNLRNVKNENASFKWI